MNQGPPGNYPYGQPNQSPQQTLMTPSNMTTQPTIFQPFSSSGPTYPTGTTPPFPPTQSTTTTAPPLHSYSPFQTGPPPTQTYAPPTGGPPTTQYAQGPPISPPPTHNPVQMQQTSPFMQSTSQYPNYGTPPVSAPPMSSQYGAPPTTSYPPTSSPPLSTGPPLYNTGSTNQNPNQTPLGPPPGGIGAPTVEYSPLSSISTQSAYPQTQNMNANRYPPQPTATAPQSKPGAKPASPRGTDQKINPSQIPSPTSIDQTHIATYNTRSGTVPPPATVPFNVVDDGNSSPKFMRMTLYNFPATSDAAKSCQVPLGFVLQPFADQGPRDEAVPLIDFGTNGPLRCIRCKAYINPFAIFTSGGRQYVCKFCEVPNEVPKEYFSPLEATGRRVDHFSRPELCKGTVDFVATKEYMERPPVPPAYLFAIDVSYSAVNSGLLQLTIESIKRILTFWPQEQGIRIGFVTYDTTIHFYNLNPALQQPQMMVVPDVDSVFVPLSEEVIFVNYSQAKPIVDILLEKLPSMFASSKINDTVFGAAIQAGAMALRSIGGKLIIFQSTLPSSGPGKLVKRDDMKLIGTDKEKTLYTPQDSMYTTQGADFVKGHVCVDAYFGVPSGFVDVATISALTKTTGGHVYFYPNFNSLKDGEKFQSDLIRNLTRTTGFEGLMRVRCSRGLSVANHYGNFFSSNSTELDLAAIDSDKSILVELKLEEKLDEKAESCVQCALLYTTSSGQRRIRVFNISLPNTSVLGNLFRSADLDTIVNCMARTAMNEVTRKDMSAIRASLLERCVDILYSYRKFCATSSSPGQLILPEALKLLPIYILSVMKNGVLKPGSDVHPDERTYLLQLLNSIPVPVSSPLFYPRMIALHNMAAEYGTPADEEGHIKLPPLLRPSHDSLSPEGAFLLEDGQRIFIWLGRNVPSTFITEVFHQETYNTPYISLLPPSDSPSSLASRVNAIITAIRTQRNNFQPITFVKQGDPSELKFFTYMVEDKGLETMNYVDFLCHVHRQIQSKLT